MNESNHLMESNLNVSSFRMPLLKFIQLRRIIVLGLTGMFSFTTLVVGAMLKPKHIVIVTSDDQGWIQAGCYGHPFLKTPHLDAMAKNVLRVLVDLTTENRQLKVLGRKKGDGRSESI